MKYKRMEYSVTLFIKQSTNRNIFKQKLLEKKIYAPFLRVGLTLLKVSEPLWGDTVLLATNSPGIPGTRLIDLRRMRG